MKIGDYVRIKKGRIGIIKNIDNQTELYDLYLIKNKWYREKEIIKSSPNIIDLIEIGDLVNFGKSNGGMVLNKKDGEVNIINLLPFTLKNEDIKSVITKEQIESMEYKVGSVDNVKDKR